MCSLSLAERDNRNLNQINTIISEKLYSVIIPAILLCAGLQPKAQVSQAPAYPLITHDPNFSIWSNTDTLNTAVTKHWTGKSQSLLGIIKVDKSFYRFMGEMAPTYKAILPTADAQQYDSKYLLETAPGTGWEKSEFNDSGWQAGTAPFSNQHGKETRMPFIVSWPGHVPEGRVDDNSELSSTDLIPTLAKMAAVSLPQG